MKCKSDYTDVSNEFKQFRPTYPVELYNFIFSLVKERNMAWDCGTGNGQVAFILSNFFNNVVATDICKAQIDNARLARNVRYIITNSENSGLKSNSIDLIACAQAIHWFEIEAFFKEVRRVAKDNAIIAFWGYNRFKVDYYIDAVVNNFYLKYLDKYRRDNPRVLLTNSYKTIPFDFKEINTPSFDIKVEWNLTQLAGYLNTMSSVREYIRDNNHNPVTDLMNELLNFWKINGAEEITFPIFMRIGKIQNYEK